MTGYRYLLCDLLTDQPLCELPLSGVTFERRISRVGSFQGTLNAATQAQVNLGRLLHSYAGRAALWVYRDGKLWWGGIPWTVRARQAERGPVSLTVQGATFDSYPHHRVLREDLTYTQVDQGHIMAGLWRHLQADPRGDIGVEALDQGTGVLRDRTYLASEQSYYGPLVEQLGDVEDGAEHTIDVYLEADGSRRKRLRVAQRLGTATPSAVFQRARAGGGRVLEWDDTADAVDGGTTFQTRGEAPDGNVGAEKQPLLSTVHEATDLLAAGWPLLDVTADHSGVKDVTTLDGHAGAMLAQRAGALLTGGYKVQVGSTGWSPNRIGDAVRLKLADAWHQQGEDIVARPVACKVTAAQAGTPESVELIFGDE